MERYTRKDIDARVDSVNRRLESHKSARRVVAQEGSGHTNLYEIRADDRSYITLITAGTKREIAEYLSAMMTGMDLLREVRQ